MASPVLDSHVANVLGTGAITSITATGLSTGGTDEVLLAFVVNNQTGAAVTSTVTDSTGLTWTLLVGTTYSYSHSSTAYLRRVEIWWAPAPLKITSGTVTATFSGSALNAVISVIAISGCFNYLAPFDTNGSNFSVNTDMSGASTLPTVSISTSEADDLLIAFYHGFSELSVASPFIQINAGSPTFSFASSWSYAVAEDTVSSTQGGLAIPLASTSTIWGMHAIALSGGAPVAAITKSQAIVVC